MIEFNYIPDEGIIYAKRTGEVSIQEIIEYIVKLDLQFNHLSNILILEDTRMSTTIYDNREDLTLIIDEVKKHVCNFDEVIQAIIVDNPHETVLNILYETLTKECDNYIFAVFSTVEAAKHWLLK